MPRGEMDVAGQGLEVIEKLASCAEGTADGVIELTAQVEDGVDEKGEEEQRQEDVGQMLVTVAIVVFEVVAVIFEDIDAFVFNLPATASTLDHRGYRLLIDGVVGGPTVMIELFAGIGVANGDFAPVNQQWVLTT